jgi:predicted TIM-barrel fold metal-dependent hydrolase
MENESLEWLISVDDHVIEPGDLWLRRLPSRYHDRAPRTIVQDGLEVWAYEDARVPVPGLSATAGTDKESWSQQAVDFEQMRAGCYDPVARIADMDVAGILGSLCFPSFPRFCGQVFWEASDKELALLCVQAYNDWMVEDWCGAAPGRYIPLIVIPLWDPELAAREVRRNAERGVHAIAFSENPEPLGLPTIWDRNRYWNPLWDACQETETVVCMHIGSSSALPSISSDFPWGMNQAWAAGTVTSGTLLSWLTGPVFREFPGIKIALSEGGIGWIPYILERGAQIIDRRGNMLARGETPDPVTRRFVPNESHAVDLRGFDIYQAFSDHVYGCFIDDFHGVANVREIGIDNVMIETDYPHSDSTWPDCIGHAQAQLATNSTLTNEEKYKILRGNAERLFQFTPAAVPASHPAVTPA